MNNDQQQEAIEITRNFMHHAAFNLINSAETSNPELMWAVLVNTQATIESYIQTMSEVCDSIVGSGE